MDIRRSKKHIRNQVRLGNALWKIQAFVEFNGREQENPDDILSQTKENLNVLASDIEETRNESMTSRREAEQYRCPRWP